MNRRKELNELFFEGIIVENTFEEEGFYVFFMKFPPDGLLKVISKNPEMLNFKKDSTVLIQGPCAYDQEEGFICFAKSIILTNGTTVSNEDVLSNKSTENHSVETQNNNIPSENETSKQKTELEEEESIDYESMYSDNDSVMLDDGCVIEDNCSVQNDFETNNNVNPMDGVKEENEIKEENVKEEVTLNEFGLPLPNKISLFSKSSIASNPVSSQQTSNQVKQDSTKSNNQNINTNKKTDNTENVKGDGRRKFTLDDLQ